MSEHNYIQQISDIKKIISERTKFNALSGVSGILAGTYALVGAFVAKQIIDRSEMMVYDNFTGRYFHQDVVKLYFIAAIVLIASISTGIYFSYIKAKKAGELLLNKVAVKIIRNFSIFLLTAFIVLLAVYAKNYFSMMAPLCLIFYGLALINVSSFIASEVYGLGLCIVVIGVFALFFPGNGLLFWSLGFGLMHIIYGTLMWYRYDRKQ